MTLQEQVLLAVLREGPDATAADVQAALTEAAPNKKEHAFGSVFVTLDRLSDGKMVRWKKGEPDAKRGGRAPRLYTITALGRSTLAASLRTARVLAAGTEFGDAVPGGVPARAS